jgi:hypothetical protein
MSLEQIYQSSQIVLVVVAVVAGIIGYRQLEASNRYELLKLLEDERFRKARRLLWKELCAPGKSPPCRWWTEDKLEEAAGKTCASFDIVALMATRRNRRFFTREWWRSICWTYELLEPYILERHDSVAYKHYRKFYREALPFKPQPTARPHGDQHARVAPSSGARESGGERLASFTNLIWG